MNRFHRWYCRTERWARVVREGLVPWVLRGVELGAEVLEVGPGPGLTTDLLRQRVQRLTAVEIDGDLARSLAGRLAADGTRVIQGDATQLPFEDESFSGAVCFTMLHHVPSTELQDRLLREVRRVLQPGATFAGSDSTPSLVFRMAHWFDTMVLVDPDRFGARLEKAGFDDVAVQTGDGAFRFRAVKRASGGDGGPAGAY